MKQICLFIESCCKENKTVLIVGDLNCSNIDWSNYTVTRDESQVLFYKTISDLGFSQFIDGPTRGENILDILLCNDPQLISNVQINEPFSTSDHSSINFTANILISDGYAVD